MADTPRKSLTDLPKEVLLDNLLPALDVKDLLSLSATNHDFAQLCDDETFWKLKCKYDFNFSGNRTARTKGWRFIYKGLADPKVFVWGSAGNGRLGMRNIPRFSVRGVPHPIQLTFPKKSAIVDLIAGAWSFHALDSWGNVFVWGTMDGDSFALQSDGFSEAAKVADTPLLLQLPEPVRALSCGRKHSTAFDTRGQIWTFLSWGRPFRLVTPALDGSSSDSMPVQVECGWTFSVALTESGNVYAWWPFDREIQLSVDATMEAMNEQGNKRAESTPDNKIPCATWDLVYNPPHLPPIPVQILPKLHDNDEGGNAEADKSLKLVKIAAADNCLIGLTNAGHVLKMDNLNSPSSALASHWEYLPRFSETRAIREHPIFTSENAEGIDSPTKQTSDPPKDVRISHITAHYRHFVTYTGGEESIVLKGSVDTDTTDDPEIIPELQYKSIISVALGDYHSAALTSDGRLFTWGAYSDGALGLGDPKKLPVGAPGGVATQNQLNAARAGYMLTMPAVPRPTEVRFDHGLKKKRDRFCFAATAAGWHTGALVIDLDPEEGDDAGDKSDSEEQRMPGHFDPSPSEPVVGIQSPFVPFVGGPRGGFPFRVGHAGRVARGGLGRGFFVGRGRGGQDPNA